MNDPILIQLQIERAVGGTYSMQDGRFFWIDTPVAQEITRRVISCPALAPLFRGDEAEGLISHG